MPQELDLVETQDLLAALTNRYDEILIIASKQPTDSSEELEVAHRGTISGALGLVRYGQLFLDNLASKGIK